VRAWEVMDLRTIEGHAQSGGGCVHVKRIFAETGNVFNVHA
jgi:hypothetical protein